MLGCTGYLVMVTQGTATIINEVTGLPFYGTLFIAWAGYTLFTLYSGSSGVVLTDTMMFLLFAAVAFLGLAFIVEDAGGWFASIRELATYEAKPGIISWHGATGPDATWKTPAESLIYAIILGVAWGIVVAVSPWQASRYLMARNEHIVIRSATITAGVVMALYVVLMLSGAAVNLLNPEYRSRPGKHGLGGDECHADAGGCAADVRYPGRRAVIGFHLSFAGRVQRQQRHPPPEDN